MPKIVGIDLGTTNSVIAVVEGQEATVITLSDGNRLCASVVGFNKSGERLVGQLAKRQALALPERTIRSIKRKMGTNYVVEIDNRIIIRHCLPLMGGVRNAISPKVDCYPLCTGSH